MQSFASHWPLLASPHLLLNKLTLILGSQGNSLGQDCLRGLKIPPLCLRRHLAKIVLPSELSSPTKKAQLCQLKVTHLGYIIEKGSRALAPAESKRCCKYPPHHKTPSLRIPWGRYCRLRILEFTNIAKPLYACTGGNQPLTWTEIKQAFDKLKTALTMAPALALPDISKPFRLFVHERQDIAKGVLTQMLGP
ncbi:LOW QUALITY PROTEIN: Pol polyprotein [Plecturocebus cupreus]